MLFSYQPEERAPGSAPDDELGADFLTIVEHDPSRATVFDQDLRHGPTCESRRRPAARRSPP